MPNLPPSPADFAKLIARVETLERAQPDRAKSKLEQLDDVATPQPATGSSLVFDGVKWVPGSTASGFPVGPEDDGTYTYLIAVVSPGVFLGGARDDALTAAAEFLTAVGPNDAYMRIVGTDIGSGANGYVQGQGDSGTGSVKAVATDGLGNTSTVELKVPSGGPSSFATDADTLGFYGVSPVVQAGTPSTLGDVITILQDLGLCS